MRLARSAGLQRVHSSEVLILVRHGVDVPILSHDLNQPLTEETKPDIQILGREIAALGDELGNQSAHLWHSNRLRAVQTATILSRELVARGISMKTQEAAGVREIHQGRFIIRGHVTGTEYKPLVDAWNAWQKKLDACELLYRFGDPLSDSSGSSEFPELVGWFQDLGEHQGDFSLRLYRFLKKIFEERARLQIIVGHQASCSRIQRAMSAVSKLRSADEFRPGEFVRFLEKKGSRVAIEPACGIALEKPDSELIVPVLEKEIAYLESVV